MKLSLIPKLARLYLLAIFFNLIVFTVMRVGFFFAFNNAGDPMTGSTLLKSFYVGMKFDFRLAVLMNLPLLLLGWAKYIDPFVTSKGRKFWLSYLLVINTVILLTFIFDFGHYAYLQLRLDVTALRFLLNPLISMQMIWETYPVVWLSIALGIFLSMVGYALTWAVTFIEKGQDSPLGRRKKIIVVGLVLFLTLAGGYGKFSYYPLRWSDAFFSPHPFASSLALNPVLYFTETLQKQGKPFKKKVTRKFYPVISKYLGVDNPDIDNLNFIRNVEPKEEAIRPNVVFVFLESFAFYKIGAFGNPLNSTPNFDKLAKESLFFKRFYTPSSGTARSVFAAVTGIADVESRETASRNPLTVKQNTIINAFKDYDSYYFLGGSANWANIRGLLTHNIDGIKIYEEGSYSAPRVDVWGISDMSLFEAANNIIRDNDGPFFSIIHTSGNHRPYTIPDDNKGFKYLRPSIDEIKKAGFKSVEEFNSYRFMDHSIGYFMEVASKEDYYDNTIFVFFGDHGLPGHAEHMPRSEDQLKLTTFHVPLVIHAPGLGLDPQVYQKVASEVDLLPTIAGLVNVPYLNTTLGRDLLDPQFDDARYAFTITGQSRVTSIGLIGKDFYFKMRADGSDKNLYDYNEPDNPRRNIIGEHPEVAKNMQALTKGIHETAKYMQYHNSPENFPKKQ